MEQRPIVIKRIKKAAHAHHGGSWKVAYADFVTAMMAFFLLMWLMGFTTEGERKAISDYFQSPSAIQGQGGSSTSMIDTGGGMDSPRTAEKKINQDTMSTMDEASKTESRGAGLSVDEQAAKLMTEEDKKRLESLMDELKQAIEASQAMAPFKDQLLLDITSEGLRIQIIDKENRPMFDVGSANLQQYTRKILREIAKMISSVPNRVSIAGHTDARGYASDAEYTNWELSADRANSCRRELMSGGVADNKFARVVGLSSTALFNKDDPLSPVNRRISIVVLNRETDEAMRRHDENKAQAIEEVTANSVAAPLPVEAPVAPPVPASAVPKVESVSPRPTTAEPTVVKKDVVKPEPVKTEPAKPEPPKPEPVKAEPPKVEPPKVEPAKVESAKTGAAKPAPAPSKTPAPAKASASTKTPITPVAPAAPIPGVSLPAIQLPSIPGSSPAPATQEQKPKP